MELKLFPIKIECYDMDGKLPVFDIESVDEYSCKVQIAPGKTFNLEEWKEVAEAISQAIERLELE